MYDPLLVTHYDAVLPNKFGETSAMVVPGKKMSTCAIKVHY